MVDLIEQMQIMGDKIKKLKDLTTERDLLVSQLSVIDNEIRLILNAKRQSGCSSDRSNKTRPNEGTDAYHLTEVMSDKPMHKNDILAALEGKGHNIKPHCVDWYLSHYDCFQNSKRGCWSYVET